MAGERQYHGHALLRRREATIAVLTALRGGVDAAAIMPSRAALSRLLPRSLATAAVVGGLALGPLGCALTSHATRPSTLGTPRSTADMLAVIDQPGPVQVETVVSADWAIDRSGLIDLGDPRSKAAGLVDGMEPIQVYFHVLRHPQRGMYLVDTGMERAYRDDRAHAAVQGVVARFMNLDALVIRDALGDFLAREKVPPQGVFLTHLHLDHVSGMPDLPRGTPIFMGPGETQDHAAHNLFLAPNIDRALDGQVPLSEWGFQPDPSRRFDGVLDVFGDGTVWALLVPGHTAGSTAYVVRTPTGTVLLTGDVSHTVWGWEHDVPPGSFTADREKNVESLARLRQLAKEHPHMIVRLGHQALPAPALDATAKAP
jgi:glyoxylase-like metal-dependent hydrolase (beta-lactamase superfamily II)